MKKTITLVAAAILSGGMAASQGVSEQSKAVMENIFTRSSVREYVEGKKIKVDEYIEPLLRAGMSAPSAMNRQPLFWFFVLSALLFLKGLFLWRFALFVWCCGQFP